MRLIPTILCGGAGSRLWPVSRDSHPKPFIRLPDGQSLLQKAFLRAVALPGVEEILTVSNNELFLKTQDELAELNLEGLECSYILEPCRRNTAAAITAAALYVAETQGEDAILLVLAADHLISDQVAFSEAVNKAMELAHLGKLVTFGIQPTSPETGYGYMEVEGNQVLAFVEKPSLVVAQQYLDSGRFLWNSGLFCFSARSFLREMAQHAPDILNASLNCFKQSIINRERAYNCIELDSVSFKNIPENSIDYALMEKSEEVAVVPCSIGWSDIGSWNALDELIDPDLNGNRILGDALVHQVKDCTFRGHERLIGAIGIENLIIVDTPDALLIANKAQAQDVKHLYTKLKMKDHDLHKLHRTVHRPWGAYTVLEEGPGFKIKRIVVKPGASLSLQMHQHRSEHWVVVGGVAKVVNGEQELVIKINESTFIPAGHKHRLENPGSADLVIIEVQSGHYLGEDDIARFEDVYGRLVEVA